MCLRGRIRRPCYVRTSKKRTSYCLTSRIVPPVPCSTRGLIVRAFASTLARLVRFPKGDAKRAAAIAVSEDDVADVAWLAADAGMDDFAHDTRNVVDPVGRRFEEVHP